MFGPRKRKIITKKQIIDGVHHEEVTIHLDKMEIIFQHILPLVMAITLLMGVLLFLIHESNQRRIVRECHSRAVEKTNLNSVGVSGYESYFQECVRSHGLI